MNDAPIAIDSVKAAAPGSPKRSRAAANRGNAQLSTGPKTTAGKKNSRLNALSHGLTSSLAPVIPGEDPAEYAAFCSRIRAEWDPSGALEEEFVLEIASLHWRLRRIAALEAAAFHPLSDPAGSQPSPDSPEPGIFDAARTFRRDPRPLATLSMHEHRLRQQLGRSINNLAALQNERKSQRQIDLIEASGLRKYSTAKKLPFDPKKFGFDFSVEEIDNFNAHAALLAKVATAAKWGFPDLESDERFAFQERAPFSHWPRVDEPPFEPGQTAA